MAFDGLPRRRGSVYRVRYWALDAMRRVARWPAGEGAPR